MVCALWASSFGLERSAWALWRLARGCEPGRFSLSRPARAWSLRTWACGCAPLSVWASAPTPSARRLARQRRCYGVQRVLGRKLRPGAFSERLTLSARASGVGVWCLARAPGTLWVMADWRGASGVDGRPSARVLSRKPAAPGWTLRREASVLLACQQGAERPARTWSVSGGREAVSEASSPPAKVLWRQRGC